MDHYSVQKWFELELEKCLFGNQQIQTWNYETNNWWQNVYVGRPLQRRYISAQLAQEPPVVEIGSSNDLFIDSIWTNADLLSNGSFDLNFNKCVDISET